MSPFVDRRHGTERAVAELVEWLAAKPGVEVYLYAQWVEAVEGVDDTGKAGGNIHWRRVATTGGPHLWHFLFWLMANKRCLERDSAQESTRSDVVFSPGINSFAADVVLVHAVFGRLRELQTSRGGFGARSAHRWLYYRLVSFLEDRIYRNRKLTLAAVSRRTARQLETYYGRPDVSVIPNGVDTATFSVKSRLAHRETARRQRGYEEDDVALLLVGNDLQGKGLPVLLDALQRVPKQNWKLDIVGSDQSGSFQSRLQQAPFKGRVQFRAEVQDMREVYAAADVYVAPSIEDSFNLPALEAMSCGIPAVISTDAGMCEHIADRQSGMVLKDSTDAEELSRILIELMENRELRSQLGEGATTVAARLTWDAHAEAVYELLCAAARRKQGKT